MTFEDFWKAWRHPKNRGSKLETERLFNKMTIGQRTRLEAAMPRYFAYCDDNPWYQPMQARRFINPRNENWDGWAEAQKGEDADLSQIQRETEEIRERNRRRQEAADEAWRQKYERQFGHRP